MTQRLLKPLPSILALFGFTILLCQCQSGSQPTTTFHRGSARADSARADSSPRYGSPSGSDHATEFNSAGDSRPGLGTSWGESRRSHVDGTEFERAGRRPDTTLAIRYNDAGGIPAGRWSARQPFSAGSIASVGIKSKGRYLKCYGTSSEPVVVGKDGEHYSIYVKNRTAERIEVVLSVDGLDVLDGKSASHSKRGYVVGPHETIEVEGFRRSYESVAAFRFGSVDSSYAARSTGSTRNVGVIGAAVFKERETSDWQIRKHADPFPGERGSGQFAKPPGA